MSEPKFKRGDMVRISKGSNMHAEEIVLVRKSTVLGDGTIVYDFIIPEVRGSVPEKFLDSPVITNFASLVDKKGW